MLVIVYLLKNFRKKKPAPVIFMGKPTSEDCAESGGMSAFGFMSFAMAITNAVINTANNINSNNNNNNNNNNDNNNNLVNINIANANNAAGNENMATAGRRRRLQQLRTSRNISEAESEALNNPEEFATAIMVNGDDVEYKPLRIGYTGKKKIRSLNGTTTKSTRNSKKTFFDRLFENVNTVLGRDKRSVPGLSDLEGGVSFISLQYIGLVAGGLDSDDLVERLDQLENQFSGAGPVERKVSQVLSAKVRQMIRYRQNKM